MNANKKMAAVALLATAALAGCGKSSDNANTAPPLASSPTAASTPAVASTPAATSGGAKVSSASAKWAKSLCTAVTTDVKQLQPPSVTGTSPAATQQALATFFTQVGNQLGNEVKALESAGPPPGSSKATAEYNAAKQKVAKLQPKVAAIQSKVANAKVNSAKDLASLETGLRNELKVLAGNSGPVSALAEGVAGSALRAEPACASLV